MALQGTAGRIRVAHVTLYASWVGFADEATRLVDHFRRFAASGPAITGAARFQLPDECLLEGLLSRAWQAWGTFCRDCVVKSCMGTVNGSGANVVAHPFALSESHVSSASIRAKSPRTPPPYWGGTNSVLRHEPTWADVDVLVRIVPRLGCSNHSQLTAAVSSSALSAKALQAIRNSAAHTNAQTMSDVLGIRSRYVVYPITHPIQALFWTDPSSGDYLVTSALEELVDCGFDAIS